MKAKPYIGITGITSGFQVWSLKEIYANAGISMHSSHIPMLGILVSQDTLLGKASNRRYPHVNNIPNILLVADEEFLTMIHYHTKDKTTLAEQVSLLFKGSAHTMFGESMPNIYNTGLCRAIQLNIYKPPMKELEKIKKEFPDMQIVFQASKYSMRKHDSPAEFADYVSQYNDFIDYVLIDPSGGRGEVFDIDKSVNIFKKLSEKLPVKTIGFAGNLNDKNVEKIIVELIEKTGTKDFCTDTESGTRVKLSDKHGDDVFNMNKAQGYLNGSSIIL
ncbi:MAG: hypothetical protein KKF46_00555 [Nanoarchaeota archaeon]|nr:hypothetical protein [Nanoarchaeota archaeon]MBU1320825.1 hypothetical protein [Nanoarchaeota archaeon]MBU1596835.1 hypothetical protein [Nanoarchaeota archaeon]MBU2440903.1 hypothetical protein [Nanoarchaeota archaeon]